MNYTVPIEMPRGTHFGNNYHIVYSSKLKRKCCFFSDLEYYNFLSLEINPMVDTFCEQPAKIEIIEENKIRHVIFDMWVRYKNGREEFQEVKYESELTGNSKEALRSQEQIRKEQHWCDENNISFIVRTDKTIPSGRFFIKNANVIAARLRRYCPTEEKYYNPLILTALKKTNYLTISEMINSKLLPLNNEFNHLCYMYEKGLICMNIADRPIDMNTEVILCQN